MMLAFIAAVDPLGMAVLALIAVGITALVVWVRGSERRELATTKARLGLELAEGDELGIRALPLPLLREAERPGIPCVLWGIWGGMEVRVFDLAYTVTMRHRRAGQWSPEVATATRRHTCAVAELAHTVPTVVLDRGHIFAEAVDHLEAEVEGPGGLRLVRTGHEEFDRRFAVESSDPQAARELFTPDLIQWLLLEEGEHRCFQLADRWLLCYGEHIPPSQIESLLEALRGFHDRLPA